MSSDWRVRRYRGRWYAVRTIGGVTKRISLRLDESADRATAERVLLDGIRKPDFDTIAPIMDAYILERQHTAASPERIQYAWDRAKATFGGLRPDHITRDLCRSYLKQRRLDGVSDSTVRKELETIRAALRWANKHHKAQFDFPRAAPPKERFLTREEAERLRSAAHEPHIRLFIALAIGTGARASAILDLTWDRVDLTGMRIVLGGRTDKRRKSRATVPINARLLGELKAAQKASTIDHVIEYGGKPVKSVKRGFANACERAGLDGVTPHTLRHTAASWMAMAGVPMSEIAAFLGHSDSRITERVYAKFSPDYLAGAAKALE